MKNEVKGLPEYEIRKVLSDIGKELVLKFVSERNDELKSLIKQNGGKVLSSISGNLDYLVAGENMGPSKRNKADALGVPIINESDFIKMLEQS